MLGESIHQLQWDGMVSLMVQLVVLKLPAASMEMCPPKGHGSRGSFMPAQGLWSILVLDKIIWDKTCFTQSNLLTIHLHEHFFWFLLICPSLSKMTNHCSGDWSAMGSTTWQPWQFAGHPVEKSWSVMISEPGKWWRWMNLEKYLNFACFCFDEAETRVFRLAFQKKGSRNQPFLLATSR